MEFGIFLQGYNPEFRRAGDPDAEHKALMNDMAYAQAADRAGFKYAWMSEHHFLDEYSHLSANDVLAGYLAHATERIHIGSGIFNPLPQVNHPAKVAERVAMLDHVTNRRFEFGTGRGAGSHEILGFLPGMEDLSQTREIWEDVIGEFPKMWLQDEYEGYQGKYWSLPPRKVLPKPYGNAHPAMWYAAGNTSSYAMAAQKGLGVLGFSVQSIEQLGPVVQAYKKEVVNAEPIGAYVNDNVMVTTAAYVRENVNDAVTAMVESKAGYLFANVMRYHDTFPHPEGFPKWPDRFPDPTPDMIPQMVAATEARAASFTGTPNQALEAAKQWEAAGADQLAFGLGPDTLDGHLESIRLLGEYVIPKLDTDPVHRTTRMRDAAG